MATAKQRAWRAEFVRRFGKKKGSRSGSSGGGKVSKKGNGKQGIVSWLTSVIAIGIGLSNVFVRAADAMGPGKDMYGSPWKAFNVYMLKDYAGYDPIDGSFNARRMIRGYAPIVGAVAFKKGTSYLVKTAKLRSLIPRIG